MEAILYALNLIETCYEPGKSHLLSVNTDGIFTQDLKRTFTNKKDVKFSTKQIGNVFEEDKKITYFEKNFRENLNINDFSLTKGQGSIYTGKAGSGKTRKLIEELLTQEKPLVSSFTNKAVENIKERSINRIRQEEKIDFTADEVNNICKTFDSYFCEWNDSNIKHIKDKTVLIDKFSMVPNKFMTLL